MKELTAPIDRAGRIVLPKGVREELAIKPGDMFNIVIHGSAVTLTPRRESTGLVRKGKALVFSSASEERLSDETVEHLVEQARGERDEESTAGLRQRKGRD